METLLLVSGGRPPYTTQQRNPGLCLSRRLKLGLFDVSLKDCYP